MLMVWVKGYFTSDLTEMDPEREEAMRLKESQDHEAIICKVKEFRLKKGWSQQDLATAVAVRRQAIYDIESGRYLPNTAIALRLARVFACRVEDLFVEQASPATEPVHITDDLDDSSTRLALGRVRNRLVGLPLHGSEAIPFGLRPADGLLNPDGKSACIFSSSDRLEKTIILMGCDPAFEILGHHVTQRVPEARVHCRFASSHRALRGLAEGMTHIAGTHLHNTGKAESNVIAARNKLSAMSSCILGFSLLEEGLMVAKGNPLGIRTAADLAQPGIRFVNREEGAALRVLLDDHLKMAGIHTSAVNGYQNEVASHREGAFRIACNVADAALGLRAVAEAFDLGFVPITAARCDLVIPNDITGHPTVKILLDVLQSAALRREIDAIPGYEAGITGRLIGEW